jgi:hypothetical protein
VIAHACQPTLDARLFAQDAQLGLEGVKLRSGACLCAF